jgi:hypothetical protein
MDRNVSLHQIIDNLQLLLALKHCKQASNFVWDHQAHTLPGAARQTQVDFEFHNRLQVLEFKKHVYQCSFFKVSLTFV